RSRKRYRITVIDGDDLRRRPIEFLCRYNHIRRTNTCGSTHRRQPGRTRQIHPLTARVQCLEGSAARVVFPALTITGIVTSATAARSPPAPLDASSPGRCVSRFWHPPTRGLPSSSILHVSQL